MVFQLKVLKNYLNLFWMCLIYQRSSHKTYYKLLEINSKNAWSIFGHSMIKFLRIL